MEKRRQKRGNSLLSSVDPWCVCSSSDFGRFLFPKQCGHTNGAKTLLGAPGLTTRNKKLLGAPGIATRSKDATRGSYGKCKAPVSHFEVWRIRIEETCGGAALHLEFLHSLGLCACFCYVFECGHCSHWFPSLARVRLGEKHPCDLTRSCG